VSAPPLAGRRAVITGAGRGLGLAIARRLAADGATVVLAARTVAEIEHAAETIVGSGGTAIAIPCDITDEDSVAALAASSVDEVGGPIDTLVNNAGVYLSRRFADHSIDDWRWMMDVNVLALVRVTQAFLPMLLDQPRSRVINVSSIAGKKASFGQAAYNASKHAQIGITRCLALETGHTGLRVNAVCPGFTPTELLDLDEIGAVHGKPGSEVLQGAARAASIGRLVTPDEIAEAVAFLAGPGVDGMNGQSLVVDGGLHMS
jgi:NAD(P)-dependent dehydrogenase (short-subunit alcohol dehydrogenase family)